MAADPGVGRLRRRQALAERSCFISNTWEPTKFGDAPLKTVEELDKWRRRKELEWQHGKRPAGLHRKELSDVSETEAAAGLSEEEEIGGRSGGEKCARSYRKVDEGGRLKLLQDPQSNSRFSLALAGSRQVEEDAMDDRTMEVLASPWSQAHENRSGDCTAIGRPRSRLTRVTAISRQSWDSHHQDDGSADDAREELPPRSAHLWQKRRNQVEADCPSIQRQASRFEILRGRKRRTSCNLGPRHVDRRHSLSTPKMALEDRKPHIWEDVDVALRSRKRH